MYKIYLFKTHVIIYIWLKSIKKSSENSNIMNIKALCKMWTVIPSQFRAVFV